MFNLDSFLKAERTDAKHLKDQNNTYKGKSSIPVFKSHKSIERKLIRVTI